MKQGCPYGTHRVLEPAGAMPQAAWRLDNSPEPFDNELLIDVERLNIDAASFRQLEERAGGDERQMAASMLDIVARRGKHHNPVTGSGGMLLGTVAGIGPRFRGRGEEVRPGDRIVTLVSLTLTPLWLEEIISVDRRTCQARVRGRAILFETGLYARLPDDIPESLALAVLDVAGAPAQTARLVREGERVFVVGGGGKSGLLCGCAARKSAGPAGKVLGLARSQESRARMVASGFFDVVLTGDARRPLEVMELVREATGGAMADVSINCASLPGTELGTILATRDGGKVYFFNMATSFTAAALGAEGVGKDVTMIIGSGYCAGHARYALELVRENEKLQRMLA